MDRKKMIKWIDCKINDKGKAKKKKYVTPSGLQ